MQNTPSRDQYSSYIGFLRTRLAAEGWVVDEEQLEVFAGVLPAELNLHDVSIVTDTEAAFILGETLVLVSWTETRSHLTTKLVPLPESAISVEWDAVWLAEHAGGEPEIVPGHPPIVVTLDSPDGATHVLPYDEAWVNPDGCVEFAATLIEKARGFRPGIGTPYQVAVHTAWKR